MPPKARMAERIQAAETAICNRFMSRLFSEIATEPPARADEMVALVQAEVAGIDGWMVTSPTMGGAIEYLLGRVRAVAPDVADRVMS